MPRRCGGTPARSSPSQQTRPLWDDYAAVHQEIVSLDNGGRYDAAVGLATTTDDIGSTAKLNAFDARSQEIITASGSETADALRNGNTGILVLAIVTLLLGTAAAGMAVWGIGLRRREYA